MRNIILRFHTAADIDKSVEKVLHDLGNPEPPLSLDEVRQLLKLDLGYYSSHKDGMLAEVAHRMVMAGKQILARPTLIWDAIKTGNIRALYLYDRKKIFIDDDLPELKIRWNTAHEIGHELIRCIEIPFSPTTRQRFRRLAISKWKPRQTTPPDNFYFYVIAS